MPKKNKPAAASLFRGATRPLSTIDTQVVYCGDNLDQLRKLPDDCVDLIYIDPPFNSNRNYEVFWGEAKEKRAFGDRHESTKAYIDFMRPRCVELARVLKQTGSFYYHCDWHASHYVKVMLDQIFGENNFRNEVVWKRTSAHGSAKRFGPVHDVIFFYTAGKQYTWNPQYQAYDTAYVETFFEQIDPDGRRWKRMDLTGDGIRNGESGQPWRGVDVTAKGRHWAIPREATECYGLTGSLKDRLDGLDAAGAIHWPKKENGVPRFKQYADKMPGVPLQTVWTDIRPLHNLSRERAGYPTQKPVSLLERILKASSDPDDIVLDAFCGCGTALAASEKLERRWIGIDISPTACRVMAERLRKDCGLVEGKHFHVRDLPRSEKQLRELPHFEFQNWAVVALGGIPNKTKTGDKGIDGRIYPITDVSKRDAKKPGEFDFMDDWYPVQVKQRDKADRPDIDAFETAMQREGREKGFFVSFDFSGGSLREIDRFFKQTGCVIVPLTVREIVEEEIARKLA